MMWRAAMVLAIAATTGCRSTPGAKLAVSRLNDDAPTKCIAPSNSALPGGSWERRRRALETLGRVVSAPELDEAIVLDSLSREVKAVTEAGACMPKYEMTEGTIRYELRCAAADDATKARASRLESAVIAQGMELIRVDHELDHCVLGAGQLGMRFGYAAQGAMDGGALKYSGPVGCSYMNQETCARACEAKSLEACTIAMSAPTNTPEQRDAFAARACDLALGEPSTSAADVEKHCAMASVRSSSPTATPDEQGRGTRLRDRICEAKPNSWLCFAVLDATNPAYDRDRAVKLAARIDCNAGPCPLGALIDDKVPHHDAARTERLVRTLEAACEQRTKQCFEWGIQLVRRSYDPAVHRKVAALAVDECERKGPSVANACAAAIYELSRGGAAEDIPRAAALAARQCSENHNNCFQAGKCTAEATCSPTADVAAARAFYERGCTETLKAIPGVPREKWPSCVELDKLPK